MNPRFAAVVSSLYVNGRICISLTDLSIVLKLTDQNTEELKNRRKKTVMFREDKFVSYLVTYATNLGVLTENLFRSAIVICLDDDVRGSNDLTLILTKDNLRRSTQKIILTPVSIPYLMLLQYCTGLI